MYAKLANLSRQQKQKYMHYMSSTPEEEIRWDHIPAASFQKAEMVLRIWMCFRLHFNTLQSLNNIQWICFRIWICFCKNTSHSEWHTSNGQAWGKCKKCKNKTILFQLKIGSDSAACTLSRMRVVKMKTKVNVKPRIQNSGRRATWTKVQNIIFKYIIMI